MWFFQLSKTIQEYWFWWDKFFLLFIICDVVNCEWSKSKGHRTILFGELLYSDPVVMLLFDDNVVIFWWISCCGDCNNSGEFIIDTYSSSSVLYPSNSESSSTTTVEQTSFSSFISSLQFFLSYIAQHSLTLFLLFSFYTDWYFNITFLWFLQHSNSWLNWFSISFIIEVEDQLYSIIFPVICL